MRFSIALTCIAFLSFLNSHPASAQVSHLDVGDNVSLLPIVKVVGSMSESQLATAMRGKLVVLDFWATWCTPCIAMFPKTDSLEHAFGNRVKFVPVSSQKDEVVGDFITKYRRNTKISLSSVAEDTILNRMFYFATIPHYVWIDSTGKIIAITGPDQVNSQNLELALSGQVANFRRKKELAMTFDMKHPFFSEAYNLTGADNNKESRNLPQNKDYFHSVFTGHIPGAASKGTWGKNRFSVANSSFLLLIKGFLGIQKKYGDGDLWSFMAPGRTIIELKDSSILYKLNAQYSLNDHSSQSWTSDQWISWSEKYAVSYELILPEEATESERDARMEADLRYYLRVLYHVDFLVKKRSVESLILTKVGEVDNLGSKGGIPESNINSFGIKIINKPFDELITALTKYYSARYSIDNKVKYDNNIDVDINCKVTDLDALNGELKKYGLVLNKEKILLDVLVIKDVER